MKKLVFLFLVATCGVAPVYAQIGFGLKAGYTLASVHISDNDALTFTSKSDFHAGILVNFPILLGLSVQPEVLYSAEGAKIDEDGDPATLSTGLINVPVMVKYSFKGLFVETGPQFGFLLSSSLKEDNQTSDDKSDFNSTRISWCAGLGYKSKIGLGIDARYNFGIGNIDKSGSDFSDATGGAKNGVLQVGLFWQFGGK